MGGGVSGDGRGLGRAEVSEVKYGAILMDPPWAFETLSGARTTPHRTAVDHYKTMEAHQIAGLPVPDLAAKNCALFMWVVDSHFNLAFDLFALWGFRFKTLAFVWEKQTVNGIPMIGMGYWTRKQTEVCLLATRGSPRRKDKGVRQLIQAPRRQHSRKPDEVYARVEALVDGPYLEMFARQGWPGWDAWGNETDKFNENAEEMLA